MLDWIMQRLASSGIPAVQAALDSEGVTISQPGAAQPSNDDQTHLHAKRKAAAKARRAKVMAKFSAMQASADKKFGSGAAAGDIASARQEPDDEQGEDSSTDDSLIICIYCQEANASMCVLAYAQQSTVLDDGASVSASSCGHYMCQSCMVKFRGARVRAIERHQYRHVERTRRTDTATGGRLELMDFFCPLCNSLCNFCIPVWQKVSGAPASKREGPDRRTADVQLSTSIDIIQSLITGLESTVDIVPSSPMIALNEIDASVVAAESANTSGATGGFDMSERTPSPSLPMAATGGGEDMEVKSAAVSATPPGTGNGPAESETGSSWAGAGAMPASLDVVEDLLAHAAEETADFYHDTAIINATQECLARIRLVSRLNFPAKFDVPETLANGTQLLLECIRNTIINIEQVETNKSFHNFGVRPLLHSLALCCKIYCTKYNTELRQQRLAVLKTIFQFNRSFNLTESQTPHPNPTDSTSQPVLLRDPFCILVESTASTLVEDSSFASFASLARICLLISIVQSVLNPAGIRVCQPVQCTDDDEEAVTMLCAAIARFTGTEIALEEAVARSVLLDAGAFLRRACLLSRFCFDYSLDQKLPTSLDALCQELGAGSLHAMLGLSMESTAWRMVSNDSNESSDFDFVERTPSTESGEEMSATELLLSRWIGSMGSNSDFQQIPHLLHIRTLVPLPQEFSELFYKACQATCPVSGKAAVKPALCLICGEFICAQSTCCQVMDSTSAAQRSRARAYGACSVHSARCGAGKGIFLLPKTCTVVLLDQDRGCLYPPPYVDSHGERDPGLTRGQPLFLDEAQYAKLCALFTCNRSGCLCTLFGRPALFLPLFLCRVVLSLGEFACGLVFGLAAGSRRVGRCSRSVW